MGHCISYARIGEAYMYQDSFKQGLEFYQKALNIFIELYGDKHPHVALCFGNIGTCYCELGYKNQALDFYKKALKILLEIFGEQNRYVGKICILTGAAQMRLNDYSKLALEFLQKGLKITREIYGEQHPYMAKSYGLIGNAHENLREYKKAMEFHQKVLKIFLVMFGEHDLMSQMRTPHLDEFT